MAENKKRGPRFSEAKRDFLKKLVLFTVYIGPAIRTFEMAEVGAAPTGPPEKKKKTTGTVQLQHFGGKGGLA